MDLFAGKSELIDRRDTIILVWNNGHAVAAGLRYIAPFLGRVVLVGQPEFGGGFNGQCVGLENDFG